MPPGAIDNPVSHNTGSYPTSSPYERSQQLPSKVTPQSKLATQVNTSNPLGSQASPLNTQGHLTVPQWQLRHNTGTFIRRMSNERESGIISSSSSTVSHSVKEFSSSTVLNNLRGESSSYVTSTSRSGSNVASTGVLSSTGGGGILMSSSLSSSSSSTSSSHQYLSPRVPPVSTYHHPHPYVNTNWTVSDSNESPSQTMSYNVSSLKPPPQYPGPTSHSQGASPSMGDKSSDIRTCRSYETMDKVEKSEDSRSHPDLRLCASNPGIYSRDTKMSSPTRSVNSTKFLLSNILLYI